MTYGGEVSTQELDTDTVTVSPDAQDQTGNADSREPSLLLSNRSYWYPQNPVPDYATASIRIVVPSGYTCVASGHPAPTVESASFQDGRVAREGLAYGFRADQPLRYLALVISRLVRIGEATVPIDNQTDPGSGVDSIALAVTAHSSLRGRARETTGS